MTSKSRTGERPETCSYSYNLEDRLAAATIRREGENSTNDVSRRGRPALECGGKRSATPLWLPAEPGRAPPVPSHWRYGRPGPSCSASRRDACWWSPRRSAPRQSGVAATSGGLATALHSPAAAVSHVVRRVDTREEQGQALDIRTDYVYDNSGIRVFAGESAVRVADGQVVFDRSRRFLLDSQNHTGYAQVLEEYDGAANLAKSYLIGDDVVAQASGPTYANPDAQYLLYDGHGSTRGLTAASGGGILARFDYDAYGMTLGGEPALTSPAATDLPYTGEQYDAGLGQYYLRARYYSPTNGSFNSLDPFGGASSEPQSLHKYAYCHDDPVQHCDPQGRGLPVWVIVGIVVLAVVVLAALALPRARQWALRRAVRPLAQQRAAARGSGSGRATLQARFKGGTLDELKRNLKDFWDEYQADPGRVDRFLIISKGGLIDLVHVAAGVRAMLEAQDPRSRRREYLQNRFREENGGWSAFKDDLPSDGFGALLGVEIREGRVPLSDLPSFFTPLGMVDGTEALKKQVVDATSEVNDHYSGVPVSLWDDYLKNEAGAPTATGDIKADMLGAGFGFETFVVDGVNVEFVTRPAP